MSLHSGRKLKQLSAEGSKVTTTQTAAKAVQSIIRKFGHISDNVKYYHRGNGVWSVYDITEDRKKTGKITASRKHWKAEPWRYDLPKVDTRAGLTIKHKNAKERKPKYNKSFKSKQQNLFSKF